MPGSGGSEPSAIPVRKRARSTGPGISTGTGDRYRESPQRHGGTRPLSPPSHTARSRLPQDPPNPSGNRSRFRSLSHPVTAPSRSPWPGPGPCSAAVAEGAGPVGPEAERGAARHRRHLQAPPGITTTPPLQPPFHTKPRHFGAKKQQDRVRTLRYFIGTAPWPRGAGPQGLYLTFFLGRRLLVWPHFFLRQLTARGWRRA